MKLVPSKVNLSKTEKLENIKVTIKKKSKRREGEREREKYRKMKILSIHDNICISYLCKLVLTLLLKHKIEN